MKTLFIFSGLIFASSMGWSDSLNNNRFSNTHTQPISVSAGMPRPTAPIRTIPGGPIVRACPAWGCGGIPSRPVTAMSAPAPSYQLVPADELQSAPIGREVYQGSAELREPASLSGSSYQSEASNPGLIAN